MIEERKKIQVSPVSLAWSPAALGDFDGAIQWLETGIRERDTLIPLIHIYAELMVPALARDPRFEAILDRLQLPRAWLISLQPHADFHATDSPGVHGNWNSEFYSFKILHVLIEFMRGRIE
jgi:hypothetical protein